MDDTDELEGQAESHSDADREVESVTHLMLKTAPPLPKKWTLTTVVVVMVGDVLGVAVAVVGDEVRKDIVKQLVNLHKFEAIICRCTL